MSTARASLPSGLLLAFTAAGAAWVSMLAWAGFTQNAEGFLGPLLVIGVVVAATGAVTRWWHWPRPLVVLTQGTAATTVGMWLVTGSAVPTSATRTELLDRFRAAIDTAQAHAAPVPADAPSLAPVLILSGLGVMLLVDVLACTLGRPPLAGLPLLTVYSVPISVLGGGVPAGVFALSSAAFLALLFVHGSAQIRRWGRSIAGARETSDLADPRPRARSGAAGPTAIAVGATATALAVAVPVLVPTLDLDTFAFGAGDGGGSEVKIHNPTADLLRDLNRGGDIPLVRVETGDPDPEYLRVSTLNRWSVTEWTPGNRDIPASNRPDGKLPALQGVSPKLERQEYDYRITIDEAFESAWLPTQFPVSRITAAGDWRYDERTMDFFRWDDDLDTGGMQYQMTEVELDLAREGLSRAPASTDGVDDEFLEVPDNLPGMVESLAQEVTGRATTPFEKAVVLQEWFRAEFEYSLEASPVEGSGFDALTRFLTPGAQGRTGYCEQFAASMAGMARVLGIPARVAIGFLTPKRVSLGVYEYSAHDLHAWPELYFDGYGWIRFEPTPSDRAPGVPSYTEREIEPGAGGPQSNPGATDGAGAEEPGVEEPRLAPNQNIAPTTEAESEAGPPVRRLLVGSGVVLALVLALAPRWARRRTRRRRLDGGPEDAWDELRDTTVDLHRGWPQARSPRETRDRLVQLFGPADEDDFVRPRQGVGANPEAELAVDRIVADLELLRYSKSHRPESSSLRAEIECCIEALEAGTTEPARRRARWLPMSVLARLGGRRPTLESATEENRAGELIEHVG